MEFMTEIEALPQMIDFIRTNTEKYGIKKQDLRDIELACEEALVNIIMHGQAQKGPIHIDCEKHDGDFEVTIRDHGVPFNPSEVEIDPRVDRPLDERKIGGLGLYLIRRLANEISYSRKNNQNILKIGFRLLY
jgi:serine/threonine-protein kinase RsbW